MSVVVTVSSKTKLNKVKQLLGTKTESETIELALERIINEFEAKQNDLPDNFFEELFAEETNLADGESIQAVINQRQFEI